MNLPYDQHPKGTRAVSVICGQRNASTPNAIATIPRNTKAHQLLVCDAHYVFASLWVAADLIIQWQLDSVAA